MAALNSKSVAFMTVYVLETHSGDLPPPIKILATSYSEVTKIRLAVLQDKSTELTAAFEGLWI